MAIYYVYSGAGGSNNGSSWANAFTTLTTAFATEAAGDTLYVAHDHSESTAGAVTLTSSGTVGNPTKIICVDRAGSVPPVSADRRATAQVATTGNTTLGTNGCAHYDGIIFIAGNSTGTANISMQAAASSWTRFDNCSLRLGGTGSASKINAVGNGAYTELNNTTVSFGAVGQGFSISQRLRWCNTPSALLGTVPTNLFVVSGGTVEAFGVDLSAAGSGKVIFHAAGGTSTQTCRLVDCKLDAAVTKSTVPAAAGANEVDMIRAAASGINYTVFRHRMSGTLEEEITIVRTGGASDGTTPIAWKIDTTANCHYSMPFEAPPIAIWNDTDGSAVTATVEGIWGGGAVPNDDEVFLEVQYLSDNASPISSFVHDGKADLLTTAASQTASSETWGGSTTAFKLSVNFVPQQRGWLYARVKVARASSTFYIDPLVILS